MQLTQCLEQNQDLLRAYQRMIVIGQNHPRDQAETVFIENFEPPLRERIHPLDGLPDVRDMVEANPVMR